MRWGNAYVTSADCRKGFPDPYLRTVAWLLRIQCTGSGPSVPSTRDLTVCCLVRCGALWLLIRTEVLASGLRHAHHLVLHAHCAVHWRRQSLGFDELCLSQSDLFNHLLHVVWKRFTVLAVQYHKYNGYFTHQSFKAVSLIRHIVTKHTVASWLLIKSHWIIPSDSRLTV